MLTKQYFGESSKTPLMTLNEKECKHIMRPILKFGLTKAGISSTLHIEFIHGPLSLEVIGLFDPFTTQGAFQIAFLIFFFWKPTTSSPLICVNLSTLQLEEGIGGRILEKITTKLNDGYRQSNGYTRYKNSCPLTIFTCTT